MYVYKGCLFELILVKRTNFVFIRRTVFHFVRRTILCSNELIRLHQCHVDKIMQILGIVRGGVGDDVL